MGRYIRKFISDIFHSLEAEITNEKKYLISNNKKDIFLERKEYDVIENAKMNYIFMGNNFCMAVIDYDEKRFVCVPEWEYCDHFFDNVAIIDDEEQDVVSIKNGIGILLTYYKLIRLRDSKSDLYIIEEILGIKEDVSFTCTEFLDKYEEYRIIPIDKAMFELNYAEDIKRLLCALIAKKNEERPICNVIYNFVMLESSRSVIDILFNVMELKNEEVIFLQIYRILEYLFTISRATYFSSSYSLDIANTVELLCKENVRFSEESSVRLIIGNWATDNTKNDYWKYLERQGIALHDDKRDEKLVKYIYEQRCKIAHFKFMHEPIKDVSTLNESNECFMKLLFSIFQSLDSIILSINIENDVWDKFETKISA